MRNHPSQNGGCLGPDELKTAAEAYESALADSSRVDREIDNRLIRRTVASSVIHAMLSGERDERRLRSVAVDRLREIGGRRRAAVVLETRRKPLR